MGHSANKNPKINKNHNKQKMFRIGISVGQNDSCNLEGHTVVKPSKITNPLKIH
jgi:hypothetical protein